MNKMVELLKKHEELVLKEDYNNSYEISLEIYDLIKSDINLDMDYEDVMDLLEEKCETIVTFRFAPMVSLCKSLLDYYKVDNMSMEEVIRELFNSLTVEGEDEDQADVECIECEEYNCDWSCRGCSDEDEDELDEEICLEVDSRLVFKQEVTQDISRLVTLDDLTDDKKYVIVQKKIKDTPTGINVEIVKHYFEGLMDVAIYLAEQVVTTRENALGTPTETMFTPLDTPKGLISRTVLHGNPFVQTITEQVEMNSEYVSLYGILGNVEDNLITINQVHEVTEY